MHPTTDLLLSHLKDIRDRYVVDTSGGVASGMRRQLERERGKSPPASVAALEEGLASWIGARVGAAYAVKGSAGQQGRRFALIPYVALLRPDVTRSPTHGVYVALLFSEDCQSLWLTINQGISQFRERFGVDGAFTALARAATVLAELTPALRYFSKGRIDLGATYPYGKAYEVGAILGHRLDLSNLDAATASSFEARLSELLAAYSALPVGVARDPSIAGMISGADDHERRYQEYVNRRSKKADGEPTEDAPRPPPKKQTKAIHSFDRDPTTAARALLAAGHVCEADCQTPSFVAASSGRTYMEAHHIIPMSQQPRFPFASVDVEANIVSLCPTCHAKIHLAIRRVREQLVALLHAKRITRLHKCGLECSVMQLQQMYGSEAPWA